MLRQSMGRLRSLLGPTQRRLFLLVFLWTCLCLVIFKKALFSSSPAPGARGSPAALSAGWPTPGAVVGGGANHRALPAAIALEGPEFALPDNGNSNAIYYSLAAATSSLQSGHKLASPPPPPPPPTTTTTDSDKSIHNRRPESDGDYQSSHLSSAVASSERREAALAALAAANQHSHVSRQHQQQQQATTTTTSSDQRQQTATLKHRSAAALASEPPPTVGSQCKYNYPSLFDLQFNNIHWQKMTTKPTIARPLQQQHHHHHHHNHSQQQHQQTSVATYFLYNAYYDDRWRGGLPSVRVLAMIDRVKPPPTNCLLWSSKLRHKPNAWPLITRAQFVYAWYPAWGNYKDGLLQPWIVTCTLSRLYKHLVPDSVTLAQVPPELSNSLASELEPHPRPAPTINSQIDATQPTSSGAMSPFYSSSSSISPDVAQHQAHASSSSPSVAPASASTATVVPDGGPWASTNPMREVQYDCERTLPLTNNLPVFNKRPPIRQKFAVCVKGLDFPHDDVSVRLVEWIEMLNLLGASKIFLYELDVHENISKVLRYYQKRGLVELSPLTLPGDQPNLPEYQHLYLKNRLTAKRQNELIPYNDCLYRNLNSYQYLALLDIDEIIMPLQHHNWFDLMHEVEQMSLAEQNYSRASYNVRNVYFFDDLSGPLGTTSSSSSSPTSSSSSASSSSSSSSSSLITDDQQYSPPTANGANNKRAQQASGDGGGVIDEDENEEDSRLINNSNSNSNSHESAERGIPHYLHMMSHVYRSKNYTEPGQYVKCFHNTERVVSLHNHFPMNCFGQCTTYSIPVSLAHLQHYRKDCVGPLKQSCKNDFRVFTTRDTTIWKYKQRMIKRTTRVLKHLGLLTSKGNVVPTTTTAQTSVSDANRKQSASISR